MKSLSCLVTVAFFAVVSLVQADNLPSPALKQYGRTIVVKEPIRVKAGMTYDGRIFGGKWTRFVASKKGMGSGGQSENQRPLFILEPGAKLQYIILDRPSADGIHVHTSPGKTTIVQHVQVRDVGEDAITVKSGDNRGRVLIQRCSFLKAEDKVIQVNSSARVHIDNCYAQNFERFVRACGTCGNQNYRITMTNVNARNGDTILKMSNSKARATMEDVHYVGVKRPVLMSGGAKCEQDNVGPPRRRGLFKKLLGK